MRTLLNKSAKLLAALSVGSLVIVGSSVAQESEISFGDDLFAAGENFTISDDVRNDVFAAGNSLTIEGRVFGDVHVAGNKVTLEETVGGNVHAAGNEVSIAGRVSKDVSVMGNNIEITDAVRGNVRAAANQISLESDVRGSVAIGGNVLSLDGEIGGDLQFGGNEIQFGPDAKVLGEITIHSSAPIEVPESVASADRVTFNLVDKEEFGGPAGQGAWDAVESFDSPFDGFIFAIVLFVAGLFWLALMPKRSENSYDRFELRPWRSILIGAGFLALLIGSIFVSAITLIGIVLIPFIIVAIILAVIFGQAAGGYFIARRLGVAFGQTAENLGVKLILLVIGIGLIWVLGLVPFIGWMLQLAVFFVGLGGMTMAAVHGGVDSEAPAEA